VNAIAAARHGYTRMVQRNKFCMPSLERMEATIEAPAIPAKIQRSHAGKYEPRTLNEGARPHPVSNTQASKMHLGGFLLARVSTNVSPMVSLVVPVPESCRLFEMRDPPLGVIVESARQHLRNVLEPVLFVRR